MAHRRLLWLNSLLIALMAALPGLAWARPAFGPPPGVFYTVTSLADGGSTPGACTLREAITAANGGGSDCGPASAAPDVIDFGIAGTITLNSDLPAISGHLTIDGGNMVTLDGATQYRILTVNSGQSVILQDFVLNQGHAASEGGAIHTLGILSVTNVTFMRNQGDAGGGAISSSGITDIRQSEFLSNTAANGGAILNTGILYLEGNTFEANISETSSQGGAIWSSGRLTIVGDQFIENQAGGGGAIYVRREVDSTSLSITGAAFDGNRALALHPDGNGGALLIDNLAANIQASTFTDNVGQTGGAIYLGASGALTLTNSTLHDGLSTNGAGLYNLGTAHLTSVTLSANYGIHGGGIDNFGLLYLTNVTLSKNQATYGGGLKHEAGTARLTNVTLWGNNAGGGGGGITNDTNTHLYLTNVIVANSPTGGNCTFVIPPDLSQFNLSSDHTCNFGSERVNLDLKLDPLANNGGMTQTHMPQLGSPAIANGTDANAPGVDQRGFARPQGVAYDVGSVEVRPGEAKTYLHLPVILR